MNKNDLVKLCLSFGDALETYPFKDKAYEDYAVIRHESNNKWFALIFYLNEKLYVNLKCTPVNSAILRDEYSFITPAWHMNKTHWIKADIKETPKDILKALVEQSYLLTK